ncbi:WD40-repeat-containing domain protein [Mycotypha africana]|uniref:WD40-repeat-containing domain protein n=1 Tax=Mycotypha africana TaxID=64632 RepID=UPI002301CE70|nr:WD40-repeat-containing domain protein [Mycotypha africana]KAI8979826.1 WD40-repeat-containing domain protein [Mycotypha africana]
MSIAVKRRLSDATNDQQINDIKNNKHLKTETGEKVSNHQNGEQDKSISRDAQLQKVFDNMRLRRIVKENHGCDINQLSFFFNNKNFTAPVSLDHNKTFDKRGAVQRDSTDTSNILATCGGCELSVYDNEHCGDHLDIMSNYDITPGNDDGGKDKNGDALLATAGADKLIHILSLAHSEEIKTLEGHTKLIYDLQSHPHNDHIILSTSKDGTIRLWDVDEGKCLVIFEADATVSCFHPSGEQFISGNARGEFRIWDIPSTSNRMDDDDYEPVTVGKKHSRLLRKIHGDTYIDCIRFANGHVLSKSINGKIEYWDYETEKTLRSFRIRSGENFCRLDVSLDELFFCVGSSQGSIFIYNLETGKLVTELGHRRSTKAVHCCVFSRDCRQIVAAGEDGFIMRYDYIDDDTLKEWDNWRKTD